MRTASRFPLWILTMCAGAFCASAPANDAIPVKPEDRSPHFAAVAKHLELGGLFFTYADVDGDLNALGGLGDRVLDSLKKTTPAIPPDLKTSKIIEALGLDCVKAVGMSSRRHGDKLFHNRALVYMPDGPRGLLKLAGGKAAPFPVTAFAPADAGLAAQVELSLSALLEISEGIVKAIGREDIMSQYRFALALPVPTLNMNVGELLAKLNARVMVVLRIEDGAKLSIPGSPVEIPRLRVMLALDDIDFLMAPLVEMAGENDSFTVEKGDGFTTLTPNSPMPGDLTYFKPALHHDHKNRRMILTTHLDMATSAGRVPSLAESAEFKKASEGLPVEGNSLAFVTPQCMQAFMDFYRGIMEQTLKTGGAPGGTNEVLDLLLSFAPVPSAPVVSIHANVPEGMLFMSNLNENHKHTLVQAAVVPVTLLAMGTAGFYAALETRTAAARQGTPDAPAPRAKPADRPADPDADPAPAPAPARAVRNNLQQIAFSAQTWFLDHPDAAEVTYETLVKSELIFDLDSVAGESYKGLTFKREGGEVSVKLKSGNDISYKYQGSSD